MCLNVLLEQIYVIDIAQPYINCTSIFYEDYISGNSFIDNLNTSFLDWIYTVFALNHWRSSCQNLFMNWIFI